MADRSLIVAGIDLSLVSWLDFDQRIEPISGATTRRMAGGAAFKLSHWRKYRITLSASGWVPPTLWAVDFDGPFEVQLPFPVALRVGESLPAGWSSRSVPWVEKTVTDQAGVSMRYVFIKLTVISDGPTQSQGADGNLSWELILEQI